MGAGLHIDHWFATRSAMWIEFTGGATGMNPSRGLTYGLTAGLRVLSASAATTR